MATSTASTSLTGADRAIVAKARELAASSPADALADDASLFDVACAYAAAYGPARVVLEHLADLAERLAG